MPFSKIHPDLSLVFSNLNVIMHWAQIKQTGEWESMKTFQIQLASIGDVKEFVNCSCQQPFDIDIVSGRYIIDAKSIMGIFSIDLSKPIRVEVHGTDDDCDTFRSCVDKFVV